MKGIAAARWRYAWRSWMPGMAAIAVLAAVPAVVSAVATATDAAVLRQGLTAVPISARSVTVSVSERLDPTAYATVDDAVSDAMPQVATGHLRRQVAYRALAPATAQAATDTAPAGGSPPEEAAEGVVLAGTDEVGGAVRLLSGRLPNRCSPSRCEVLSLSVGAPVTTDPTPSGAAETAPLPPGLGLVVVGTAQRVDPLLLGGTFDPGPGVPLLLGEGVAAVSELPALTGFGRSMGWSAPVDPDALARKGSLAWLSQMSAVTEDLVRQTDGAVTVDAPVARIAAAQERADASSKRFVLLSASVGALLLGTALLSGSAVAQDHRAWTRMLRRRGARPWLVRRISAAEVLLAAALGTLVGGAFGALAAMGIAHAAGLPVISVAGSALRASLPGLLLVVVAAMLLSGLALARRVSARGAFAVAVVAAMGVSLVLVRGEQARTADPLPLLLPVLLLVITGAATAAIWPMGTAAAARVLPRRAVSARLALGASPARSIRPAVTAGLLAAALAASLFAVGYRQTLRAAAVDEAAYVVPAQAVLSSSPTGARPEDVLAGAGAEVITGAAAVDPVLHAASAIRTADGTGVAVSLIGLPPEALTRMPRWESVTGASLRPADAAHLIHVDSQSLRRGTALPAGSTQLRIGTSGALPLVITAYLVSDSGLERGLPLRWDGAQLVGQLPSSAGGWRLTELALREPVDANDKRQHNLGEGGKDRPAAGGEIVFTAVATDTAVVVDPWRGWTAIGTDNGGLAAQAPPPGAKLAVTVRLVSGRLVLSGRGNGPGGSAATPIPALVDSATAKQASGGVVTLRLNGGALVLRVVGVLERFPRANPVGGDGVPPAARTQGRFAVIDRQALAINVDRREPGTGQADQVWLNGLTASAVTELAQPPFAALNPMVRSAIEQRLANDPVAQAASSLLIAMAGLVLLVAVLALLGLVLAERADDSARLIAWEADGLTPQQIRAVVRWRTGAVAVPALLAGLLGGAVLTGATARMVALTATGEAPAVPLSSGFNGSVMLIAVIVGLGGIMVAAWILAAPVARARVAISPTPR